jgi:hypothetical protein
MPYWEDWIRRDSRFSLPNEMIAALMTPAEVHERLNAGQDPAQLGLEKWQRIAALIARLCKEPMPLGYLNSLKAHIGYSTCGLCISALAAMTAQGMKQRSSSDKCTYCRLATIDQCTSQGSNFEVFESLISLSPLDVPKATETDRLNKLASLAEHMILNLRKLEQQTVR